MPDATSAPESRVIRVFLSSTFRDFMQERDLLVKQVFPELRRKARERGVEVVDVDLRWGITEEESRQGKVIPICLGEIDRCRPYFVGMLGERYGWIPPADQYSPQVIERQPWLKDHLGGVSVTELEILHGVLNDPAMAGRAFFYFRDPAWSTSQSEPGFVCETPKEETKLADLKQQIRNSRFPVAENLPDPKALADQIGQDLWELIEEQYPDLDEADALEREERQHASYRRSRLGVYLGGKRSINQLERWIDSGQQKILITGESGAGKSALIANWIEVHRQNHPEDVVLAHHLGCSNDASAIRPLLARLIDTAKQQLPEIYGYSLDVPQDWWELVAKAVEALQSLGRWAMQNNHRWIWVLDGLDRLAPDDQKALPWLPITIPEGVVIVASALECPAREILLERRCKTRTIAPLTAKEQDALIKQYLGRYTKQLIAELRQAILSHPLARSPLFLRVLLEELRQCGRYETLGEQLTGYLSAETIDDLYERVLERLEADGNGQNVRKVMTALWASRAGLSEEELLSITGLKPLQWAPIDLALEEGLGCNGNLLVFDHDYLRKAVEDRYLPTEEERLQANSELADWFGAQDEWDSRKTEELPWQLIRAGQSKRLKNLVVSLSILSKIIIHRGAQETRSILTAVEAIPEFDEKGMMAIAIREILECKEGINSELLEILGHVSLLLSECGLFGELLKDILNTLLETKTAKDAGASSVWPQCMIRLVECQRSLGEYSDAIENQKKLVGHLRRLNQAGSTTWLDAMHQLALTYQSAGDNDEAIKTIQIVVDYCTEILGGEHPSAISAKNDLALFLSIEGRLDEAESIYEETIALQYQLLGPEDYTALIGLNSYACLSASQGKMQKSLELFTRARDGMERLKGPKHPDTLTLLNNTAVVHGILRKTSDAIKLHEKCLALRREIYGSWHVDTLDSVNALGKSYCKIGAVQKAGALLLSLRDSLEEAPIDRRQDVLSMIEVLQEALSK